MKIKPLAFTFSIALVFIPMIAQADNASLAESTVVLSDLFGLIFKVVFFVIPLFVLSTLYKVIKSSSLSSRTPKKHGAYQPPDNANKKLEPSRVRSYGFLHKYKEIRLKYENIKDINERVESSIMTTLQKGRSKQLRELAEKIVDNMRLLDNMGEVSATDTKKVMLKIMTIEDSMVDLTNTYKNQLSDNFNNIEIPDSYAKQDELEALRIEGMTLLVKVSNDPDFDDTEDKFRLNKIIDVELDQVWDKYVAAKASYYKEIADKPLGINKDSILSPDAVLDIVFSSIRNIYNEIDSGVKKVQKDNAMTDLLVVQRYLEKR